MSDANQTGRHQRGFWHEVRDAVAPRTVLLVLGVLLVQLAFVASYVGAFHDPVPSDVEYGVVATGSAGEQLVESLDGLDGHPLAPELVADRDTAVKRIEDGDLPAALVVDPTSKKDELLVASGGGATLAGSIEEVTRAFETEQGRTIQVNDVVPLESGDARGLTGFYLVVGWLVGGYLVAALLGVAKGSRPANPRRAVIRLGALVAYAVASGLGGALIVDQWLGALTGHFWALSGLGMLLVLAAATVTMALQVLFGIVGIGLTVLLFVVLGNPSAGGAYQMSLLPGFFRAVGPALPNGAGTESVRKIVYFGGNDVTGHLWVIVGYIVGGVVLALLGSLRYARRD